MAIKKTRNSKFEIRNSLKLKLRLVFSILLIMFGVALVGYVSFKNFDFSLKKELPAVADQTADTKAQYSKIKSINIPKIKRDLPVEDGNFTDGRWEVSGEGVSFYTDSSLPEAGGNTVLYGHNKERVLGGLVNIRRGDKIDLTLKNGKVLTYEVFEVKTIKPSDISILNTTSDSRLTIYTCTGFLDSARFVVVANPITNW